MIKKLDPFKKNKIIFSELVDIVDKIMWYFLFLPACFKNIKKGLLWLVTVTVIYKLEK